MLSSLLAAQDELGYLPDEAIEEVATFTESTINEVWGVASFYTNFRFTPPGEHVVEVCWGPTCHLEGGRYVLQGLLDSLHLEDEGETEDGRVTSSTTPASAPAHRRPLSASTTGSRGGCPRSRP